MRANNGPETDKELANCIRRIAFLGTPFRGNDKTLWAKTATNFLKLIKALDTKLPKDLVEKSENLAVLGKEFPVLLNSRAQTPENRIEVACFYEGFPTELGGENIKIVEESSTRIPGCPNPYRLDASHQRMCEFESKDDINYKRVSRQLARWARELANRNAVNSQMTYVSHATFSGANNSGFQLGQNAGNLSGFSFGGGRS